MNQKIQMRQGDVFVERIAGLPEGVQPVARDRGRVVLAYGEVTGHAHATADRNVELFDKPGSQAQWLVVHPTPEVERDVRVNADGLRWLHDNGLLLRELGPDPANSHLVRAAARITGAVISHEEHADVVLLPGIYEKPGPQREYSPEAIRNVAD